MLASAELWRTPVLFTGVNTIPFSFKLLSEWFMKPREIAHACRIVWLSWILTLLNSLPWIKFYCYIDCGLGDCMLLISRVLSQEKVPEYFLRLRDSKIYKLVDSLPNYWPVCHLKNRLNFILLFNLCDNLPDTF